MTMAKLTPAVSSALTSAASSAGLAADLVFAVAWVESRYNPDVVSPVGAMGLMQIMPALATKYNVADPFDPSENARAGAAYLARLIKRYEGDVRKALAAYNWGPSNVDKGKAWPASVEAYVSKILGRLNPITAFLSTMVDYLVAPLPLQRFAP